MDGVWNYRDQLPAVPTDLGPLPHVEVRDTETAWATFQDLQDSQVVPSAGANIATLAEVMALAREKNRVCPKEPYWTQLCQNLRQLTGRQPPEAITGPAAVRTPPLVKRLRLRDQLEWAQRHGQLDHVLTFFQSMGDEQWVRFKA